MRQSTLLKAERQLQNSLTVKHLKLEKLLTTLRKSSKFSTIEQQIRNLDIEICKAELLSNIELAESLKNNRTDLQNKLALLLSKVNLTLSDLEVHYDCEKCHDTGYTANGMCSCLKKVLQQIIVGNDSISLPQCTFASSHDSEKHNNAVIDKCKTIATNIATTKLHNILLTGATGTGKTYLLACIANQLIDQLSEVIFITAYKLNQQLLSYHLSDNASKAEYLDSLCNCDVLIIDDLGCENIYKNVTIEYLVNIINERTNNGKSTMISTNLPLNDLRARYGDRIFSRLTNTETTLIAQLIGKDKRNNLEK